MKFKSFNKHWYSWVASALTAALYFPPLLGAGFSGMVSPPRFELKGNPGEVIRERLEIQNADDLPASYSLRTADWDLDKNGGVVIHPAELQPGSCRPWARLERASLRLPGKGLRNYRFEIHIPEDATVGECRLALLVETSEDEGPLLAKAGKIQFPVQGRIAVIIYVAVGGAKPNLRVDQLRLEEIDGQYVPVALLHNSGNAHGRPEGLLDVTDAMGQKLEFNVSPSPILPGESRTIPIRQSTPQGDDDKKYSPPLKIKGLIEWEDGDYRVDTVLGIN